MASLTNQIRVRFDAQGGIIWIDTQESIPAGHGHQLTPEVAVRIGRELVARHGSSGIRRHPPCRTEAAR
jgi:hypothetical protein